MTRCGRTSSQCGMTSTCCTTMSANMPSSSCIRRSDATQSKLSWLFLFDMHTPRFILKLSVTTADGVIVDLHLAASFALVSYNMFFAGVSYQDRVDRIYKLCPTKLDPITVFPAVGGRGGGESTSLIIIFRLWVILRLQHTTLSW